MKRQCLGGGGKEQWCRLKLERPSYEATMSRETTMVAFVRIDPDIQMQKY
jgi:hypothetical protein